jgi:hypothetical protein
MKIILDLITAENYKSTIFFITALHSLLSSPLLDQSVIPDIFKNHHSPTLTHSVARFHTHITYNLAATSTAPNNAVMLENHSWCWTVDTMTCFINNKDTTSYQVPILTCIQTTEYLLHCWPQQGSLLHRNPQSIMTSHDSCDLLVRVKRDCVLTCLILKCKTGMYVCNIKKTQTSPYFIYIKINLKTKITLFYLKVKVTYLVRVIIPTMINIP